MAQQTDISKMETTKTAVEWLAEQIHTDGLYSFKTLFANEIKQAKQMEKEQIKKAYKDYHDLGYIYGFDAEKYYNETYEKQSHL